MKTICLSKFFIVIFLFTLFACLPEERKNEKVKYQIEIKPQEDKTDFEKIFSYAKESLSLVAIFIGFWLTYPLLKKKLVENHISNTLQNIQDTNRLIQRECQVLIDRYVPLTYSNELLRKHDIEKTYIELSKLYYEAQLSSSDVVTILFYLKNTLQGTLKHFEFGKYKSITSRDLYGLCISLLELTSFFCSKVVQIPHSSKIEKSNVINPKLKRFVTNVFSKQYKYFSQGVIFDEKTSHLTLFYAEVNKTNHELIKRAAFRIFQHPSPIGNLLFLGEIYAPLILEKNFEDPLTGKDKHCLFLIGFSIRNQLSAIDGSSKKVIDLDYCNPDDFYRFVGSLRIDDFKQNYKDVYIKNSEFTFDKISFKHSNIETVTIQMDLDYLKKQFNSLKSKFTNKLKI